MGSFDFKWNPDFFVSFIQSDAVPRRQLSGPGGWPLAARWHDIR